MEAESVLLWKQSRIFKIAHQHRAMLTFQKSCCLKTLDT